MVAFDPISLVVEGISQVAIYFIDADSKSQIDDSKKVAEIYTQQAEASKEDAILYQLYSLKAKKQQEQTKALTNAALKGNRIVVYTLVFVFLFAFITLYFVFKIAFGWLKKPLS